MKKKIIGTLILALSILYVLYLKVFILYTIWLTGLSSYIVLLVFILLFLLLHITCWKALLNDVDDTLFFKKGYIFTSFLYWSIFILTVSNLCSSGVLLFKSEYKRYHSVGGYLIYLNDDKKIAISDKWGTPLMSNTRFDAIYEYVDNESNKKRKLLLGVDQKENFCNYLLSKTDYELEAKPKRLEVLMPQFAENIMQKENITLLKCFTYEDALVDKCLILGNIPDEDEMNPEDENKNYKNEYFEVGNLECFYFSSKENGKFYRTKNTVLYVKSFENEKYYYIGFKGERTKYLVTKSYEEEGYNAYFDANDNRYFLIISEWVKTNDGFNTENYEETIASDTLPFIPTEDTQNTKNEVPTQSQPQKIVIEHHRDPQPMQEFVKCYSCYGSGKCMTCSGTGRNLYSDHYSECLGCGGSGRCTSCAGQGGHYEIVYR